AQMVDEGVGCLGQPAAARLEPGIEHPVTRRPGHRYDGGQRKALVGDHVRVTDDDARADAPLLIADGGIELQEHDRAALEPHSATSVHPSPGTQRTALPAW